MEKQEPSTNVCGTLFDGADLRGADLSGVIGLTVEQLSNAVTDETTVLPVEIQPATDSP